MKIKSVQSFPAVFTLAVIGFSYFSQWCTGPGYLCYRTFLDNIFLDVINPLYFFSLFFLPTALVLVFVPRGTFHSWLKLAVWMLPLSALYIALTPVNSNAFMDLFPFYRDDAARLAGGVFTGASLGIVLWNVFTARRA